MNKTDWIVYGIVILAVFYIIRSLIFRKGKKGCCAKGCAVLEKTPEKKPLPTEENDGGSSHKIILK